MGVRRAGTYVLECEPTDRPSLGSWKRSCCASFLKEEENSRRIGCRSGCEEGWDNSSQNKPTSTLIQTIYDYSRKCACVSPFGLGIYEYPVICRYPVSFRVSSWDTRLRQKLVGFVVLLGSLFRVLLFLVQFTTQCLGPIFFFCLRNKPVIYVPAPPHEGLWIMILHLTSCAAGVLYSHPQHYTPRAAESFFSDHGGHI